MTRILIVGGYGTFGACIAERLARETHLELIIAGRDEKRAADAALAIGKSSRPERVRPAIIDASNITANDLRSCGNPTIVINASGPFQVQDYGLARATIAAGTHYIDLADARPYVTGVRALDAEAKDKGVLVVSGASSVPGLSSSVVQSLAQRFGRMTTLDVGISPGNSFDPGLATVASILSGLGRPIRMHIGGNERTVYGWQGLRRHAIGDLGPRRMGYVDVPDLELFPESFPELETMRFQAGVEAGIMHMSLWAMSWLARAGLLRHPARFAPPLLKLKRKLGFLGSDRGGMFVSIAGTSPEGPPLSIEWTLVAKSGHGPYVPATPSVILAKKLAAGTLQMTGAVPCMSLFTPDEFASEIADLDIEINVQSSAAG